MEILLLVLAAALFLISCAYAFLIYHSPAPHGFTWVSVVVGDGFNDLGLGAAILIVLIFYGLIEQLWWLALLPMAAHVITGLPMIAGQEIKRRRENKNKRDIRRNYGQ